MLSWFEALRERIVVNEPFLRHLRTALDRITEPGSLRAQLLAVLVIADYFVKTAAEREELVQQALDMARASEDPLAVVAVINLLVISNINASDTRESLRLGGEMLTAATAAGRPDGALDSLVLRARCLLELGEGEAFEPSESSTSVSRASSDTPDSSGIAKSQLCRRLSRMDTFGSRGIPRQA